MQAAVKGLISGEAAAQEQACEATAVVFGKCGQGADCQLWAGKSRQERGGGKVQKRCWDEAASENWERNEEEEQEAKGKEDRS